MEENISYRDTGQYRIRISGVLDPRWSTWLDGMTVTQDAGDTMLLTGRVDQAALYRIIAKLRNLGLTLVSLAREP